ncbi:hypothetical protein [Marinobacter halotolerans]|uniref:hypothetical protein n=1 Tax=Marinobacter halotolerans TaxID=1569211 RepID=UPI00177C0ADB|nr:hypothetical protein [Marinobacter halotolerans]
MLKKNPLLRAVVAAALTMGLSACISGDDDEGGSGLPSEKDYVAGQFKDASVDGTAYPQNLTLAGGQNGRSCSGETHYFETEDGRIRVYGSTAFSETDFRVVSTMIQTRLDLVMGKFGISWDEFVAQRPHFTLDHLSRLVSGYRSWTQYESGTDPSLSVAAIETQSETEALDWETWQTLSLQDQLAFAESYAPMLGYAGTSATLADLLLPRESMVVCLSPGMSGSQFGEGSQLGIQVPPETSTYHSRVGEIFTHEIVHFVQANISHVGQSNPFAVMPRWFTEGQAVYLAGQSIASVDHHHNLNAANIVSFLDEELSGYDSGFMYKHYGLAYKYVHENNGTATIVDMMQSMKSNTDTPHIWQPSVAFDPENPEATDKDPGLAFQRAFVNHISDHTGTPLEIKRYRTSYHDLMNGWASQQ